MEDMIFAGESDVVEGYMDGFRDTRDQLPRLHNRSALYVHGWKNGRDDRLKQPRASAAVIRAELAALTDKATP